MAAKRVIPVLLINNRGLWKGVQFRRHKYVGDPQNALRVFSEKMVDELVMLDIEASLKKSGPDIEFIRRVANECYMPFAFGGGIKTVEDVGRVLRSGAEKVVIGSAAVATPDLIERSSNIFGRQSIVVSIDYKKGRFGNRRVYIHSGQKRTNVDPVAMATEMAERGAGELIVTAISNEGLGKGLDLELLSQIAKNITIPVIGGGGVGSIEDIVEGVSGYGLSAVAVGSFFTFTGPHRSVLINYPVIPSF
jgi:cyclase